MNVMSLKNLEERCKDAVAIGTVISVVAMVPIHIIGMYALFIKIEKAFNPSRLQAKQRQKFFANRIANQTNP